jgi:ligand-binding sensor domain-containing protein
MTRFLCIVVVFIFGFFPGVVAQQNESEYLFRNWSTSEGLPQSHITDLCQDPSGFIWVTTFDGIAKFDGYSFTTFDQTNIPGLRSSFFTDLFLDTDSTLYFVSDQDLVRLRNSVISCTPLPFKANYRASVCASESDSVYFSIDDRLYFFNGKSYIEIFRFQGERINNISLNGALMGIATNKAVYFISRSDHKKLIRNPVRGETIINDSETFYTSHSDSIVAYSGLNGNVVKTDRYTVESGLVAALAKSWPAYIRNGDTISYLNGDGTVTKILLPEILLTDNWKCFRDMRGNFWFGSHSNGLLLARKRFITNFAFTPAGYSEVYFVTGTKTGVISGACDRLYSVYNKSLSLTAQSEFAHGLCIYDYYKRNEQESYYATFQHGLIIRRNNQSDTIAQPVLSGKNIFCLYPVNDSVLMIGSDQGADVYNMNNRSATAINTGTAYTVYQFSPYKNGQIAIATDHGVIITDHFQPVKTIDSESGLKSNTVRSLHYDREGNLWIGLAKYGLAAEYGGKIVSFPIGKGYLDKNILSITPDLYENFWITTNHGLQRVSRNELKQYATGKTNTLAVSTFGTSDGLWSPEFNSHTQSKSFTAEDKLWLPGLRSLVCVSLKDQPQPENYPLNVEVEFNGTKISPNNAIDYHKEGHPSFSISVSYADYSGGMNRFYEYRIPETDSTWKTVTYGDKHVIPIVQNGTYTLQVRRPGEEIPFTQQIKVNGITNTRLLNILWLMVFILGAAGVSLTAVIIYTSRKQKRLQVENENFGIRLVALQKQINPHFIFNCLNSLQSLFIMNKRREANAYLVRFASLLRAMIDYSRKEKSTLKDEIESCENYLELENLRFDESTFEYQINVSSGVSLSTITPSFLIQPFLENSLKHGTMPGKPLIISIDVKKNNNTIKITLKDNGQGPGSSGMQRTNSSGIRITAERLSTFNRLYATSISFVIMDRKTLEAETTGTQVEITIGQ